jgi:uncharacterized membrane protein YhaH (DUF805 family)
VSGRLEQIAFFLTTALWLALGALALRGAWLFGSVLSMPELDSDARGAFEVGVGVACASGALLLASPATAVAMRLHGAPRRGWPALAAPVAVVIGLVAALRLGVMVMPMGGPR